MIIDWDNSKIEYVDSQADTDFEFNRRINKFLTENGGMGLNRNALLDKCINILIDFMEEGLINNCRVISFKRKGDNYEFQFECIEPDSAEQIKIAALLEVSV